MHLPIVALPQLGQRKVVSVLLTKRKPHELQIFSWLPIKSSSTSELR
jgi:hypothetical protein